MQASPPKPKPKAAQPKPAQAAPRAYVVVAAALAALSLAIIGALAYTGWSYYRLPLERRVRAVLHDDLKPGGRLGRRLGLAGSGLMLLNLAYMARRRVKLLQRVGTQRLWLEIHVFCGLTGPAILVFHSAFLTTNVLARITAASTVVVVISGIVGRYIYAQLPRNIYGLELTLAELRAEQRAAAEAAGLAGVAIAEPAGKKGAPRLLLESLRADLGRLRQGMTLRRRLRREGLDPEVARDLARATLKVAALGLRITNLHATQRVMARWRGVHLKLAFVMVVAMVVHVTVVSLLGYGLW